MIERFSRLPSSLVEKTRFARLGPSQVPALLAHPDWSRPAPVVIWMHGRTANKELDAGRYIRWIKAGIAACAIDLPGHGEREGPRLHSPADTLGVLEQAIGEIDQIVEALSGPEFAIADGGRPGAGAFDLDRMALGGMSAGGMAVLRRLCDEHPFVCAAVEGTTGWLGGHYGKVGSSATAGDPTPRPWSVAHPPERVARLDPMEHLGGWRPIPLLALHSEADQVVSFASQRAFIEALRAHYRVRGADQDRVQLHTWPETGAPYEHIGFGRFANDAKNMQTEFLQAQLLG